MMFLILIYCPNIHINHSYGKLDTNNPGVPLSHYKNIPKDCKGVIDYITVSIPIHLIISRPSYYKNTEKIIEFVGKWKDLFPFQRGLHMDDSNKRIETFTNIVKCQVFNTSYIKVYATNWDNINHSGSATNFFLDLSIRI